MVAYYWFQLSWIILIYGIPLAALIYWKIQPSLETGGTWFKMGFLYGISLLTVYVALVFIDKAWKHFGEGLLPSEVLRSDPIASIAMILLLALVETLSIFSFRSGYHKLIYGP